MNIEKSICLQIDFFGNNLSLFILKFSLNQFEQNTVIETIDRLVAF
jgi:hypothetical protein